MTAETLSSLREKHPRFIYEGFDVKQIDRSLQITFSLRLEPDIVFHPQTVIPVVHDIDQKSIETFVFHLGLVESISYWKAACPSELVVNAGNLNEQQIFWWHDLFIHGLGEFFYQNKIDFSPADFLTIKSSNKTSQHRKSQTFPLEGDLVMVGGGKDSVVTMEALGSMPLRRNALLLNPTQAALEVAKVAGFLDPIIVSRSLDPQLIKLNQQGYLNGHTPFSAYLAFLGVFVSSLHKYRHIIASNEQSAAEGSIFFHGLEINHQYSKGERFEKLFREYCQTYLHEKIEYFSLLRPLYELQIAKIFAQYSEKYSSFYSCNVNRGEGWCGQCPKCAFVYLALFPFIEDAQIKKIFGRDFFKNPRIQKHITDLVGLGEHKPFDCVGTVEESIMAVALAIYKYEQNHHAVPPFLKDLRNRLTLEQIGSKSTIKNRLKTDWVNDHFLPPEYVKLVKQKLSEI